MRRWGASLEPFREVVGACSVVLGCCLKSATCVAQLTTLLELGEEGTLEVRASWRKNSVDLVSSSSINERLYYSLEPVGLC